MTLMSVENVGFAYGSGRRVLEDVSFAVPRGANVGLVGESGSGKSTLLRLMLGLDSPQQGQILFDGAPLEARDRTFIQGYRKRVQAVFQDPYSSLNPAHRIGRIVSEPLRSLKVPGDHRKMAEEAITSVGLSADTLDRFPHQFSGGQRQRIAIARAIVARPELVLADEAVSALDLSTRVRVVDLFQEISERMTMIFVSHDMGVVAALCDQMVVLDRGRIVEAGATAEILRNPQHAYTQSLLASIPRMPEGPVTP
ncbi:Oligopeptide transport ATP-binding protein OppF [Pseudooceanicola marinus]|uniref:Oligopeptide transport ATP-binding protein OppF n=1 Tax=Pseudooceanicola marinus TaxID=396013 RepID=A0A1X7A9R8_9RHOB|nr:ABC transporter ATP-binding protein [Pseudooceanicola marinus]PJE25603.1 ABC transporter ATP-binding protein [Pseudooceanicola marinus]SLN74058.1 Oligopeptide transport ATP-binding protein OppF [Pseudooceanicola marinus]